MSIICARYVEISHAASVELKLLSAEPDGAAYQFALTHGTDIYTLDLRRKQGPWWVGLATEAAGYRTEIKAKQYIEPETGDIFFRGYLWLKTNQNCQWAIELLKEPALGNQMTRV